MVSLLLFTSVGCSSKGPLTELKPVLEGLGDPTESVADLSQALVRVLDAASRQAIADRAAKLTSEAGVPVDVAQVLQTRGLSAHRRVAGVEVDAIADGEATLLVHLTPLMPAPLEGEVAQAGQGAETVKLIARVEDGQWRLSLQDLAPLIGRVSLVAQGEAR